MKALAFMQTNGADEILLIECTDGVGGMEMVSDHNPVLARWDAAETDAFWRFIRDGFRAEHWPSHSLGLRLSDWGGDIPAFVTEVGWVVTSASDFAHACAKYVGEALAGLLWAYFDCGEGQDVP